MIDKPKIPALAIGAGVFALAQAIWMIGHEFAGWRGLWMLKQPAGIALCLALLAVTAAVVCGLRKTLRELVNFAVGLGVGAIAAMIVALMIIGPGNLWPIVIAFDSVMIAAAVFFGAIIAMMIQNRNA